MGIFGNLFNRPSEEEAKKSSDMIENLKKYRGEETGRWLSMMQRDQAFIPKPSAKPTIEDVDSRDTIDEAPYSPPVDAQYGDALAAIKQETLPAATSVPAKNLLVEWVEKLFSEFAIQAAAFNSSAQGTHLVITVHNPEFEWQAGSLTEYTAQKKVAAFKGYLATLQWGMLVHGLADSIQIYIVPSEEILTFQLHGLKGAGFTPLMTIDTREIESKQVWRIGGSAITYDVISRLAQELLGDLVRVATGSMQDSELFAEHGQGLKLGQTVAQGYAAAAAPAASTSSSTPAPAQYGASGGNGNTAGNQTLASAVQRMSSWTATDQLLKAVAQDMPWLVQLKSDIDASQNAADSARLEDLISRLRSLIGQVEGLTADYHPRQGSKYNAS